MSEPNFAGNIIVNLASLPDFLRTPILKKRMTEFFSKNDKNLKKDSEKIEIFSKMLKNVYNRFSRFTNYYDFFVIF